MAKSDEKGVPKGTPPVPAEELYRLLFENTGVAMMFIAEDTTISLVNKEFERQTGYAKEQVEGRISWTGFVVGDDLLERMRRFHRLRREDPALAPPAYDARMRYADGSVHDVTMRVAMIPGSANSLASMIDVTERKRAGEAIRESEERLRGITANLPGVVFQFYATDGGELGLSYVSERVVELFDLRIPLEGLFRAFADMLFEEDKARFFDSVRRSVAELSPWSFEGRVRHPSGRTLWVQGLATPTRHGDTVVSNGILLDVTRSRQLEEERRRLEHQLSHSQKMDAIGQLAGGVAHDFNNILTGIRGNAYLMIRDCDPAHPHYQRLRQIEEHVERGANLTRQLLGFAREGKYELKIWSINEIVRKTTDLFLETRREIEAELRLAEDAYSVEADAGQIEQVLINLYINAGHAMPGGGRLTVETSNVVLGEEEARGFDARPGRYVRISVSDTGIGMDGETLKRIFEPFFTTKAEQGGTGLGLPSAYGIIRNHGGVLHASSELGKGSTLSILLPPSGRDPENEVKAPAGEVTIGTGTVLLVDDEAVILGTASALLGELGYAVVPARGGQEAVDLFRARGAEIDLVLLDMVMPGMGGARVLREILAIDPGARIVLSSGYGLQGEVRELLRAGCRAFIQKPYTFAELSRVVAEALAAPKGGGAA